MTDIAVPLISHSESKQQPASEVASAEPSWLKLVTWSIFMGLLFGFAIGTGQVFQPQIIVEQMLMWKFIMLKMFLSAVATGLLVLTVINLFNSSSLNAKFAHVRRKKVEGTRGAVAAVVSSAMLGCGMAVCGGCPGTIWVQLGSGLVPSGLYTLLGMFVASFIWTFVKNPIENSRFFTIARPSMDHSHHLDTLVGFSYGVVAVGMALMIVVVVVLLEVFFPYTKELSFMIQTPKIPVLGEVAWPPYVSGIIVGLLQLPAILALCTTIGSSSGVSVFTSMLLYPITRDKNDFVNSRLKDRLNYFQPIYLISATLGGLLAALSSETVHTNEGLSFTLSFIGGFLIMFGSMMGGGCTSGHGISGMHVLSTMSMLSTGAMFGGGIVTAYILYYSGAYQNALNGWM